MDRSPCYDPTGFFHSRCPSLPPNMLLLEARMGLFAMERVSQEVVLSDLYDSDP